MENNEKLIKCFVEALGISKEKVDSNLSYQSIPEWDSMAHMSLVFELEDKFNIMLDTDDILGLNSVSAAHKLLKKYDVKI